MSVSKYAGHIPLSTGSRTLLSVGSAMAAILNPERGDMVATMGETTAITPILENIRKRMNDDVTGSKLLKEQPRITNSTIDRTLLAKLPERTLGREYLNFLQRLNTHPDARPPVRFIDNTTHLFVMRRYRETHDFNHIVLEMNTNMLGEVVVKYFEAIQFGLPMCVSGAIFGASRLKSKHRALFLEQYLPWVIEQADQARFFLAVDWENHFEKQLDELQKELGIKKFRLSGQQ